MNLEGIISISGLPGLYKVVGHLKNGIIVESLTDNPRVPVSSNSQQQVSTLKDMGMFTAGDNKPVSEIMKTIFEKETGGPCIDHKADEKEIVAYFEGLVPDYDKERVYPSNMRKLFNWYNILQHTGNLKAAEENTEATDDTKAKLPHAEDKHTIAQKYKPDNARVATSKGVTKTAGVRKTGVA